MFFLGIFHRNAKLNHTRKFIVNIHNNTIPKWTTIISEKASAELMRLLALGLTGLRYSHELSFDMQKMVKDSEPYVHMETLIVHHPKIDGKKKWGEFTISATQIDSNGDFKKITGKKIEHFSGITSRTIK